MNCKPGDLAISVGGMRADTLGAIVKVIRPYDKGFYTNHGVGWIVEYKGNEVHACDKWLRPIRPDELPEETTREVETCN